MARVHEDGQVASLLDDGHGREVERVARGGLERADAALAQDDVGVALARTYSALISHSSIVARQAALEEDRQAGPADGLEEREVLHVARADLEDVAYCPTRSTCSGVITSVTTLRP